MIPLPDDEIGGAIVRRRIDRGHGTPPIQAGSRLTRDQVLAMSPANRHAMVNSERIALFPRVAEAARVGGRHLVHNGGGRYDVIAGVKLNAAPLSRDEAEELAARAN